MGFPGEKCVFPFATCFPFRESDVSQHVHTQAGDDKTGCVFLLCVSDDGAVVCVRAKDYTHTHCGKGLVKEKCESASAR